MCHFFLNFIEMLSTYDKACSLKKKNEAQQI